MCTRTHTHVDVHIHIHTYTNVLQNCPNCSNPKLACNFSKTGYNERVSDSRCGFSLPCLTIRETIQETTIRETTIRETTIRQTTIRETEDVF